MTPPTSPVHVLAGPPRARLLGVLGWALSRVAVAVAGVAAAQMLRADAYPTVTAVLVAVALAPSAVLLLLAHEVHRRAWWSVPGGAAAVGADATAGRPRRPAAPARWQVLAAVVDAALVVGLATWLTSPVTGAAHPGVPVTGVLVGFGAAHALRVAATDGWPAGAVALAVRGGGLAVAARVAGAAGSPWFAEQIALGAACGVVVAVVLAAVVRRARASRTLAAWV